MISRCECGMPLVSDNCSECLNIMAQRSAWSLIIVMLVAASLLRACGDAQPAYCQDVHQSDLLISRDRKDIARCLVAEARPGPDYYAIISVLSRRSSSLAWSARHYCAVWVTQHPSARQRAIRQLPGGPSARLYAAHWRAAIEAVDAWLSGDSNAAGPNVTCAAEHFGDRLVDAARARRAGWRMVDCGHTQNAFWISRHSRNRQ